MDWRLALSSLLDEHGTEVVALVALVLLIFVPAFAFRRGRLWSERRVEDLSFRLTQAISDIERRIENIDALTKQSKEQAEVIAALTMENVALRKERDPWSAAGLVVDDTVMRTVMGGGHWTRPLGPAGRETAAVRSSIPILAFGGLKGGVGKTTLAANLGAHYARADGPNLAVLFIDADADGGLSRMLNKAMEAGSRFRWRSFPPRGRGLGDDGRPTRPARPRRPNSAGTRPRRRRRGRHRSAPRRPSPGGRRTRPCAGRRALW